MFNVNVSVSTVYSVGFVVESTPPSNSYFILYFIGVQFAVNVPAPAPNVYLFVSLFQEPAPLFVHPVNVYPFLVGFATSYSVP